MTDESTLLREKVAYWRREAVARAWSAAVAYKAALADPADERRAADIRVNQLGPALYAIRDADAQQWHSTCEACGKALLTGHRVVHYEDAGDVHADCDNPSAATPDEFTSAYEDGFSADDMARMLAFAREVAA